MRWISSQGPSKTKLSVKVRQGGGGAMIKGLIWTFRSTVRRPPFGGGTWRGGKQERKTKDPPSKRQINYEKGG